MKQRIKINHSDYLDIVGTRYGLLIVLEYLGNSSYKCKCQCGTIKNVKI